MKPACSSLGQSLVTFDTLKQVREVEKKIVPLDPLLNSLEGLIDEVQEAIRVFAHASDPDNDVSTNIQTALHDSKREVTSYRIQASYLHKRAQSTAQSVLDSLNVGFQQLAQNQSKNTFIMARSAREDSVAIRAITLVTSFYLPFSFVAVRQLPLFACQILLTNLQTMFGMNLVDFDSESRNLVVSNQFWLYFMISVPLTAVTLACWHCRIQKYRKCYPDDGKEPVEDRGWVESGVDIEKG